MKITNSDSIKNREKELLEVISGDLDRDAIQELLAAKYNMDLDGDSLVCRDGDLVVHDNQVAYQLTFRAEVSLSLLFSRQGECLDIESVEVEADVPGKTLEVPEDGAYASVPAGEEADLDIPENGAYATVPAGEETDTEIPENGTYAAVFGDTTADLEIPEDGAYATVPTGEEADLDIPENGAYVTVSTEEETDTEIPESGAYTAVSLDETADLDIPENGAYAAASPETDTEPEDAPEIEEVQDADVDKDNPATRMASSIADMISEINKV